MVGDNHRAGARRVRHRHVYRPGTGRTHNRESGRAIHRKAAGPVPAEADAPFLGKVDATDGPVVPPASGPEAGLTVVMVGNPATAGPVAVTLAVPDGEGSVLLVAVTV